MEWTKIPTDLLQSATDDKDILAIVKYQLLWAMLERQPDAKICLRYMTTKQLQRALDYTSTIQHRVNADVSSVICHRNRQKMFYVKNQALKEKCDGQCDGQCDDPDKIRKEKNILEERGGVEKKKKVKKEFTPPTLKEVIEYSEQKGRKDLAEKFYQYYDPSWEDKEGNPVKNWKNKFNTWIMHNPLKEESEKEQGIPFEEIKRMADERLGLL